MRVIPACRYNEQPALFGECGWRAAFTLDLGQILIGDELECILGSDLQCELVQLAIPTGINPVVPQFF